MFQKILSTTRGKWAVVLVGISLVSAASSFSKGNLDNQTISSVITCIIIAVYLLLSALKTINTPPLELWKKWQDVPLNDAQLRRLERGIECEFTPKKVNLDAKYAIIVGSEQKAYKTTLKKCTCPDFKKRKLPCKHMYFLALQTGAMNLSENMTK